MKSLFILGAAAAALILTGCSSTPMTKDTTAQAAAAEWTKGHEPWNDPSNPLYKKSVYFALDSYEVESAGMPVCRTHAEFLVKHPQLKIAVEGNTDERGGREYNLALGQRRAEAVKNQLRLQGVADDRIETVSFGKERPQAAGHNEKAWSQNRRADIVYR